MARLGASDVLLGFFSGFFSVVFADIDFGVVGVLGTGAFAILGEDLATVLDLVVDIGAGFVVVLVCEIFLSPAFAATSFDSSFWGFVES